LAKRSSESRAATGHGLPRALARLARRAGLERAARPRGEGEAGFTLIELVVATAIMPIVFGAIAMGLIAVFSNQNSVSAQLTDQNDAQVVSANFQSDVQSAAQVTTLASSAGPAPCVPSGASQTQVLGLVLGSAPTATTSSGEITYAIAPVTNTNTYDLYRNVCNGSTLTESHVVARDMPSLVVQAHPVTVTCQGSAAACATTGGTPAYQLGWVSTQGVTGVTFAVTEPGSNYTYTLTAVPAASVSSAQLAPVIQPSSSCGFALPSTGTYASSL
jgi:prepilin-type N-terminal cleavage/methylation domain-containing protein